MNKKDVVERATNIEGWMPIGELSTIFDLADKYIVPGSTVCEIGSWKGRSGYVFGAVCKERGARLICIDTFAGSPNKVYETYQEALSNPNKFFEDNIKKHLSEFPVEYIIADSRQAHKQIKNHSLSLCFLDGDHENPIVQQDIENFWRKVQPGGLFFGHDYSPQADNHVKPEIDKKFGENIRIDQTFWIVEKPNIKIQFVRHDNQPLSPGDYLIRASDEFVGPLDFKLFVEEEYKQGEPFWALDNYRLQNQSDDKKLKDVSFLFYTQPSMEGRIAKIREGTEKMNLQMFAADPQIHYDYQLERTYDVGFVGEQDGGRQGIIDALSEKFNMLAKYRVSSEEYSQLLSQCKVIFNKSRRGEINMRVFEGMAIGALVTDKVEGLEFAGQDGIHFLTYTDVASAVSAIKYLLEHEKERYNMAAMARQHILDKHTYGHRFKGMINFIGKNERK